MEVNRTCWRHWPGVSTARVNVIRIGIGRCRILLNSWDAQRCVLSLVLALSQQIIDALGDKLMARRTWQQYERYLLQRWPLTLREVQVAIQCVKGKKNREIALTLDISSETVNKHLDRIYKVIGVRGRDQFVAELLIADIDDTPLQQSLRLSGEGASAVGSGFLDTLYTSRGERKRPRSIDNGALAAKSRASRSASAGSRNQAN
jgi:DNA-binding CsgD family transcriptional regulator